MPTSSVKTWWLQAGRPGDDLRHLLGDARAGGRSVEVEKRFREASFQIESFSC